MRFRRSIKLAPGFRLNLSGSGLSASVGPRGASMTFGKRGTYLNTGIPGTGLYSRQRLDGAGTGRGTGSSAGKVAVSATVAVTSEGDVEFRDAAGNPLSGYLVDQAKRQNGTAIREMIAGACERLNSAGKDAAEIHLATPDPRSRPTHRIERFEEPTPQPAAPKPRGFMGWLFKSVAARIDAENAAALADYESRLSKWKAAGEAFAAAQERRRRFLEEEILRDTGAMAAWLEEVLQGIEWPRETTVDFEVRDGGSKVLIDVDLPEVEDMPRQVASLPARGYKITMKAVSAAQVQKHYMAHVHGVGFRIVGEVFAALPSVQLVVLSAYSQRPDKGTGEVTDQYLYSMRVGREAWQRIDFGNLAAIDVVQALERFELRREMTKSGLFNPIAPFPS